MSKYYKTKENVVFDTIVNLVMIFTLLVCFLPFVYMAALSFSSSKAIINNQVLFWPVGFNLDAYKQIFTYPNFFQAYGNTFIYTIGGTTIAMLMTIIYIVKSTDNGATWSAPQLANVKKESEQTLLVGPGRGKIGRAHV